MNPVKRTVHFTIEIDKQMQTAITEELTLEWEQGAWRCWNMSGDWVWIGSAPCQTAAMLDWLASRLGVKVTP